MFILIAEMVAWAKSPGKTLFNLMEEMSMEHGFYLEDLISITKQGGQVKKKFLKR